MTRTVCALLALSLLPACGGASFDHPLSTPEDSLIDGDLIGVWLPVNPANEEEKTEEGCLFVGRHPDDQHALEMVAVTLDDEQRVETVRAPMRATRIGPHRYLSVRWLKGDGEDDASWYACMYERQGGELHVFLPQGEAVAAAIEAGELRGTVGRDDDGNVATAHVEDPTDRLRVWFEAHAETAFDRSDPSRFRRLDLHAAR